MITHTHHICEYCGLEFPLKRDLLDHIKQFKHVSPPKYHVGQEMKMVACRHISAIRIIEVIIDATHTPHYRVKELWRRWSYSDQWDKCRSGTRFYSEKYLVSTVII